MSLEADADQNRATAVTAKGVSWRAVRLEVMSNYTLRVGFADGTTGLVDMTRIIGRDDAGVFESLRDPNVFAAAYLNFGAITWPGEIDIAPDAMYDEIKANGIWLLE